MDETAEPTEVPTHSASWHYGKAEMYASRATYASLNREVWATLALAHSNLALVGAALLAEDGHSRARSDLRAHVEGAGVREQ